MTVGSPYRWLTMLLLAVALSIATGPLCGAAMAAAPASTTPSAMAAHCADMPQSQQQPPSDHRPPPVLCFTGCIAVFDVAAPLLPATGMPAARDWFFAVRRLDGQAPRPATPPPRSI